MSVEEAHRNDKKHTFLVKQKFETCHKQDSDHTKNEMAAAYVYRNTISNIERTQSPVNQAIGQPAENVIQELTHRLEKKNVKRDNVYIMFKTKFQWSETFIPKSEKKIDRQILTDFLNVIYCTNITGDHKFPPFYFYEGTMQKTAKNIKNIPNLCTTSDEIQKILTDWCNNHFVKLVKKRQQETNVSDKVLLIVLGSKMFPDIDAKNITQNDNFEVQFLLGYNKQISRIKRLTIRVLRDKCKNKFQDFCTSYDMNIYVSTINEEWYNNQCEHFIKLFNDFLSNCCTKENTMATSSINQTPKVIINVTEEDTTLKEISAQVEEQSKNRKSVGKYKEKVTPLDDVIEDLNSHKEDEEKEHQGQQDNDKSNEEIIDNFTKCSNSGQKIDGRGCQQLESTVTVDNIINGEETIESSSLNLDNKVEVHVEDILRVMESSDTSYDEANLYSFLVHYSF
ncbi:uncharacterized protein LOC114938352 isoform X1 [Nylanderia fulva]|uniref:uncharacterized protein LOC114938352 isoform X1 n=1 Tax=Nylanderia fulva TaxID=613905 RepID=UPI0010FB1DCD|nr:uncharacterized protein LOC114938352 isoform X1 [Nylanderia fulva]